MHTSLCHKIGLSGSRRTTSVLGLDLSTEIDPIFDFIVGVALYKAYLWVPHPPVLSRGCTETNPCSSAFQTFEAGPVWLWEKVLGDCQADRGHVWPRDLAACCGMAGKWGFCQWASWFVSPSWRIWMFNVGVSDLVWLGKCHCVHTVLLECCWLWGGCQNVSRIPHLRNGSSFCNH